MGQRVVRAENVVFDGMIPFAYSQSQPQRMIAPRVITSPEGSPLFVRVPVQGGVVESSPQQVEEVRGRGRGRGGRPRGQGRGRGRQLPPEVPTRVSARLRDNNMKK